ncbi:MAG: hypothetical protein EXS10_07560 [Phycisphaerales bacterium]|nr:hypothetical protein [Phycisphaerales bacterium]
MFAGSLRKHRSRSPLALPFRSCCAVTLALATQFATQNAWSQYGPVDPFDSAMRQMRSAIQARSDGGHHVLLVGLRQLKDPRMLPLFECLSRADHWSIRVDGVLGIAELSATHTVDAARIERLPEETDRDNAIQAALAIDLISASEALAIAQWDELDARARAVLCAEAIENNVHPPRAMLEKMAASKTPEVAALGAVLLLSLGMSDAATVHATIATIGALSPRLRASTLAEVSGTIVRFKLKNTATLLTEALALTDLSAESRARVIVALLTVDPAQGLDAWRKLVNAERTQLALVRASHLLLVSGTRASAEDWARVRNQDPLLEGIADAGAHLSANKLDQFYNRLLATDHRPTLAAATEGAALIGVDAERALGEAALNLLVQQEPSARSLGEGLLKAIARLAELSPESFRAALVTAELNVPLKDLLLFALAEAGTESAAMVAQGARDGASAKAEALIRILHARYAKQLTEAELLALSKVAGAGEPAVAIQAAWLWLRNSGREQECIAILCAEIDGAPPSP